MSKRIESVAKALVINEKNEVLILTVGEYKARPDKSFKPDLPGGFVDPGESERDAVIREVFEETGILVKKDAALPMYSMTDFYKQDNVSVTKHLYAIYVPKTPDVKLSWEHVSYAWVALDTLLETTELRPFYEQAIRYLLTHQLLKN